MSELREYNSEAKCEEAQGVTNLSRMSPMTERIVGDLADDVAAAAKDAVGVPAFTRIRSASAAAAASQSREFNRVNGFKSKATIDDTRKLPMQPVDMRSCTIKKGEINQRLICFCSKFCAFVCAPPQCGRQAFLMPP